MSGNINTGSYWDLRFSSGDWEAKRGRWQTGSFAGGQIPYFHMDRNFAGTLLDFGCGLGDAMPVYRASYPRATLLGVDISHAAIERCRERYGSFAQFRQGDYLSAPEADVIVASNVLEHLDDDCGVASHLLSKCRHLYVIVPYKENPLSAEHIRSYDRRHFAAVGSCSSTVFPCAGWSQFGLRDLWYQVRLKNLGRILLGRRMVRRSMQIVFHFVNAASGPAPRRIGREPERSNDA
jgi:SAM-dependent methyltransferase